MTQQDSAGKPPIDSTTHQRPGDNHRGGEVLRNWDTGELSRPPIMNARSWLVLLGPGVVLAGTSVGSGEWLLGPAATAQYGATILWLATCSILAQVFFNLEVMRYALYCGEPVHVGYMRTKPGPRFWIPLYMLLDTYAIMPMNAGAAAIPIAAAYLGHLPGDQMLEIAGMVLQESLFVKIISIVIFLVAFIPLIFGGAIYRMLEYLMATKLVLVLAFLGCVSLFMVSSRFWLETVQGVVGFGVVPVRPDTLVAGRHFLVTQRDQDILYRIRGSFVDGEPEVVGFAMIEDGRIVFDVDAKSEIKNPEHLVIRKKLIDRAKELGTSGGFYVQTNPQQLGTLSLQGDIRPDGAWHLTRALMSGDNGDVEEFGDLQSMPEKKRRRCENILKHVGNEDVNLVSYFMEHKRIPPLDWMILAAFASYAGAGGFANTLFSNFARDKGWGMGSKVGAIASAVGGTTISLSHVGMKFDPTPESMGRWRGWMRWVLRDQLCVWMICAMLGVALPCMLSLEFVRNAPVSQDRVSAMMADGMKNQYPMFGQGWWYLTLLIGFLILFPGQVVAGDGVARRWTDILWTVSERLQSLPGRYVKYIYYGILIGYAIWGIFVLTIFRPLMLVKISGALGNLAIGFAMLHTIYVNRTLLPRALRPYWFVEVGMFLGSMFFLGISGVVAYYTFR